MRKTWYRATGAELPPALRRVALHRETEREYGADAMSGPARSMHGLEPERVREAVAACEEQALDLS